MAFFIIFMIYFNILNSLRLVHWVEPIDLLRNGAATALLNISPAMTSKFIFAIVFIDLSYKTNKERKGVIMRGNFQEKGNYFILKII